MTRFLPALALLMAMMLPVCVQAQEMPMHHMDDQVMLDLSAEDWITTKTAHITVNVEAAVSAASAGNMRADMMKAVNDLAKIDWKLTAFNRSEDQTGLERWSATYEGRMAENLLGGINESAKKLGKAGMQISVGSVDFSPTLEETEAGRAAVRAQIYKQANEQLATLNAAMAGRNYRISMINFTGEEMPTPMPHVVRGGVMAMNAAVPAAMPVAERAEKLSITARVIFAAQVEGGPRGAPPITDVKH